MGLSARNKEIPLLFIATNSKLSLKFPKVIKPATMIVSGFIEPMVKELPMEYAVEMNRLIQLQMEGSIG